MAKQADIQRVLESLPRLSPGAVALMQVVNRPGYALSEVVAAVRNDAFLTAELLRVANSPYYSRRGEVLTVDRALMLIGQQEAVGLCLMLAARGILSSPLDGYFAPKGALWQHDLRCAIATSQVARRSRGTVSPDLAFTAGILHDLGKLVVSSLMGGGTPSKENTAYLEVEREKCGIDHCAAGGMLARHWGLPAALTAVIEHHHAPSRAAAEVRPLVYAVHLGDIIAMGGGYGTGADGMHYPLDEGYAAHFPLTADDVDTIGAAVEVEFIKNSQAAGTEVIAAW